MKWLGRGVSRILAGFALAHPTGAPAGETHVAVASNFTAAAREIAAAFTTATDHEAILSFGSTGQLYAQITQGAPFDIFLAADDVRPLEATREGYALAESRFTYAIGRLVLWSRNPDLVQSETTVEDGAFTRLAIANPLTAPYGAAAVQTLRALGVYAALAPRIIQGNTIAQTHQFVATGNAELGFVALAQVVHTRDGSRWEVPATHHDPIRQDAVLLRQGVGNEAARTFLLFLKGPEARSIIAAFGYGTDEAG